MLKPDYVLEVSWRNGLNDFAMPYMIQAMHEISNKVEQLEKANLARNDKDAEKEKMDATALGGAMGQPLMITQGGAMGHPQQMGVNMTGTSQQSYQPNGYY